MFYIRTLIFKNRKIFLLQKRRSITYQQRIKYDYNFLLCGIYNYISHLNRIVERRTIQSVNQNPQINQRNKYD